MTDAEIVVWLLKKYVDDVLVITTNLEVGTRYKDGQLTRHETDIQDDLKANRTKEEITMEVLRTVANTVLPYLEFTSEVSRGEENPVACLDSQLWFGKTKKQTPWFSHNREGEKVPGTGGNHDERYEVMYKF